MKTTNYQGWTNYETRLVKLWIDNDQWSQEYWLAYAEGMTAYDLAAAMKDSFEEAQPEMSGFWADLMSSALQEVNWTEIAEAFIAEAAEIKEEEAE